MDIDEGVMNKAPEMEDSEEAVEREDNGGGTTTTSSFIQELNMVLILAFLSLSADEQLDLEEIEQTTTTTTTREYTDSKGKPSVSTSQFRRRHLNIDGFKHPERHFSRSHSKIQDCRHGRRV